MASSRPRKADALHGGRDAVANRVANRSNAVISAKRTVMKRSGDSTKPSGATRLIPSGPR